MVASVASASGNRLLWRRRERGRPGDYIWDFINYNIYFSVKDAAGANLLDPQVSSNLLANEITVEYEGKTFPLENSVDTRF